MECYKIQTLGGIIDQLCILEQRIKVNRETARSEEELEVIDRLLEQRGWLIKELSSILVSIINWDRPATYKKYKNYDKTVHAEQDDYFLDLIADLNTYTKKLWSLEDARRNKELSDKERLEAADEVAVYNKKRNLTIDKLDEVLDNALKVSMLY